MKSKPRKQEYTLFLNWGKKLCVQNTQQQKIKKHYWCTNKEAKN